MRKEYLYICLCLIFYIGSCKQKQEKIGRSFQMGTIYWPPIEYTDNNIKTGIKYTLESSDILTAQIPWQPQDDQFFNRVKWVASVARKHNRKLIINLDWQKDDRKGLRGVDWRFKHLATRQEFLNSVFEICRLYNPEFLNLGVEVNFYALKNPKDFAEFVSLYNKAKSIINKRYPKIKVSVSFQLELLFGRFENWKRNSSINVLKSFNDNFDILAISTYPHSNIDAFRSIDLLAKLENLSIRPLGIFETSVPTNIFTESQQNKYLSTLLIHIHQSKRYELLVWTSLADTKDLENHSQWINYLGLRTKDFSKKKAWQTWQTWYDLKLIPRNSN